MATQIKMGPVASDFILATATGRSKEIGCFGPRGEAKTISALLAMGVHASNHAAAGFKTPVKWFGVTETFAAHKAKTHESLGKPMWSGAWRLEDGGHKAIMRDSNGTDGVLLELFGIEDTGALDRVRAEAACMWVEEPAPASTGPGVSEAAWETGLSSLRNPSHANVAIFTSNPPDEDHWTWRRFKPGPGVSGEGPNGRLWYRVPKGDNPHLPAGVREQQASALTSRPDIKKRLIDGEPGSILLGEPVAQGFDRLAHVSTYAIRPNPGQEIGIGFDGGHTPTAVIGQQTQSGVRIYAALTQDNSGMRQLLQDQVVPWLARHAPWTLRDSSQLLVGYDPSLDVGEQADIDNSALNAINEALGYPCCEPGPVRWPNRKDALIQALSRRDGLLIDPSCDLLIKALNGRWYYPKSHIGELRSDNPKKPNHPWEDLGDALIYLLCRFGVVGTAMWSDSDQFDSDIEVLSNFSH